MKITIIHADLTNPSPGVQQLVAEAKKLKFLCEVKDLNLKKDIKKQVSSFGDIIIWRTSKLPLKDIVNRKIFSDYLVDRKIFSFSAEKTWIGNKYTQQHHLSVNTSIPTIKTYKFYSKKELLKAIKSKKLTYPFIQKPRVGSKGENITLVREEKNIIPEKNIGSYIYQNFIPNDGDFRVLILGGKVLGCIKRSASGNDFRNNISQGGVAQIVTSSDCLKKINKIALQIASAFNLTMCGIDILYDKKDSTYKFLEVNSLPAWQGFQETTKINVAREVLLFSKDIHRRKFQQTPKLVEDYFINNEKFIEKHLMFHFYSRMYLWTNKIKYRKKINELKTFYIGKNNKELQNKIEEIFAKQINDENPQGKIRKLREKYYKRYPSLLVYKDSLFKPLFSQLIYNNDITNYIKKYWKDISNTYTHLVKDKKAIAMLSTHAVNFLYLTDNLIGNKIKKHRPISQYPKFFLNIAETEYDGKNKHHITLQLYLLGHCIINESQFYSKKITKNIEIYISMLKRMEKLINSNYFNVSLDNKLEFLVCSRLLSYSSFLEAIIMEEARNSLSDHGNYIIDKLNSKKSLTKDNLYYAEHRNVLYLMLHEKSAIT